MATFPSTPIPNSAEAPAWVDPVIEARFDGGSIATRSKYLRRRAIITLQYVTDMNGYYALSDFSDEVRQRALTFDFTFPQGHTIVEVKDTTPIGIVTKTSHGLRTGQQVQIVNTNPSVDGLRTITRTSSDDFTLDGTTASGIVNNGGRVFLYFPKMRFVFPQGSFPAPGKLRGPITDNHGLVQFGLTLEEDF